MRQNDTGMRWIGCVLTIGVLVVLMSTPIRDDLFFHPYYDTVNAVVGDESYVKVFGKLPDHTVSETERIQTHLAYVEKLLRVQETDHLSASERKQRLVLLDQLRNYWQAGQFPQRRDPFPKRRPCFIDANETLCAVGYLIVKTAGRDLAERINAKYQYAYLWEMQDDDLAAWVDESGMSLKELAMIQPTYDWLHATILPNGQTPCLNDFEDFVAFAKAYNSREGDVLFDLRADKDSNGIINYDDFIVFALRFGVIGASCHKVSGKIMEGDIGLQNVWLRFVELDDRWDTLTDSSGVYVIEDVPWGVFHIVPQKTNYMFQPDTMEVRSRSSFTVDYTFEATPVQPLLTGNMDMRE